MQKNETRLLSYSILNIRPEIIKLLKENVNGKLLDIGLGDDFLNLKPKAKETKVKINK